VNDDTHFKNSPNTLHVPFPLVGKG